MIGRPEWFKRRKYGGWGLTPETWQGWAYIILILGPFAIFQSLPYWDTATRIKVTIGWLTILLADTVHIMMNLDKDERETKIEALSERNAAYAMVGFLIIGILYQALTSALAQKFVVDPFLAIALLGGILAKTLSNMYYGKREL
jgi:hypothetical protein